MHKGMRCWAMGAALLLAAAARAEFKQVSYTESIQPQVRISGASLAGLSLMPAGVETGERQFWAKLPKDFSGDLTVEVTTHDHRFQATARFNGVSRGGWEQLSVAPQSADGKPTSYPRQSLSASTTALRAWIPGDDKNSRKYVLIRWGTAPQGPAFEKDDLRVQLNLGTAPEAAVFLRFDHPKSTVEGTCEPADKASRSGVYFQWSCVFKNGIAGRTAVAEASRARLIVIKRERDGRESQETVEPVW